MLDLGADWDSKAVMGGLLKHELQVLKTEQDLE